MLRKFILVAAMALVQPGSTTQLMIAQLVCLIYVVFVLNLAPYKKDEADITNQASHTPTLLSVWRMALRSAGRLKAALMPKRPGACADANLTYTAAHLLAQAANVQIMISLLIAMALKTNLPSPEDPESIIFDFLLVVSNLAVFVIGSFAFINCIQKRAKTLATLANKMAHHEKKKKNSLTRVHPL